MLEYRSAIFIPGNQEKMLAKASSLNADLIVFDLEDSVHPSEKETARKQVAAAINGLRPSQKSVGVRINDLSSGLTLADLEAVLPAMPDLVMLPKVVLGEDLVKIDAMLGAMEAKSNASFGSIKLITLTAETPSSLFHFHSLMNVSDRLVGMTWGAEDLSVALGATQNREQSGQWLSPFQLAQTFCLAKARDLEVQAIDTVYADFKDLEGLREECIAAKQIGFTGKLAIHPNQLDIINEVFSPTEEEVEYAERLVELFSENKASAVFELDGRMVDTPHLLSAQRVIERYKKA